MRCRFCGIDPDPIVIVPNPEKDKDGILETFSCIKCAIEKKIYCTKHDKPHTGFTGDMTTACIYCIEEEVQTVKDRADEIYSLICGALFERELEDLKECAEDSSTITGDDESVSVLRFVITVAHRLKLSIDQITVMILERKSAALILPINL